MEMEMPAFVSACRRTALAASLLLGASAAAMPPPVEVAPVVASTDAELARTLTALIADAGREGHFAAAAADEALVPAECALDAPDRDRCLADSARAAAVANLVFVVAAPTESGARLACIAGDAARARQAEISLTDANASDAAVRLRQRSALAGCIIGALHAPPRS